VVICLTPNSIKAAHSPNMSPIKSALKERIANAKQH
jgi:hypothetical protein